MRIGNVVIISVFVGSMMLVGSAEADDNFDIGQVSIAYSDGYIGTDHQFHPWEHRADAEAFRAKHLDRYRPWRHDAPNHPKENG
ncbi:MAG: hypothetical protein JOZ60_00665 [Verrucomicrobia bacterium]|nr:hypothetical protein [Verrucomicrobiota bacterium]